MHDVLKPADHVIQAGSADLELLGVGQTFATRSGTRVQALADVSLSVGTGEFVALVGASGCGKTTLLRIVGGLILPTAGKVIYRGAALNGPIDDLGVVFQRPVLLDWRSVAENVTLQLEMRRTGSRNVQRRLAEDLLKQVDLADYGDRYPWELSGGQQQRVSLCRALIHTPSLLLMDEPFGALDAITRELLQKDLERLWINQRPTVLFVTHDVGEAVTLADRVVVLSGQPGKVAEDCRIDVPRPRAGTLLQNSELQRLALEIRGKLGVAG